MKAKPSSLLLAQKAISIIYMNHLLMYSEQKSNHQSFEMFNFTLFCNLF